MASPSKGVGKKDPAKANRDPRAEHNAKSPDADAVFAFHSNADTDSRPEALHHTIGSGANQAASGSHTHDAADPASSPLWTGVSLTDPPTSGATPEQLAAAVVALNLLIRQKSG